MDPLKYAELDSKTDAVFNLTRRNETIDPRYTVEPPTRAEATKTGHLEAMRIRPSSPGDLPSFSIRWDENRDLIDVDLVGGKKTAARLFKLGVRGYSGHHPRKISDAPRVFHIDIHIPALRVCEADVGFNLKRSRRMAETFRTDASVSADARPKGT